MTQQQSMTFDQLKACKAIVSLYETGKLQGDYALLVVLKDRAGITFGKNQTTENSGGLFSLLEEYKSLNGTYVELFEPYMKKLFDGKDLSKTGALTEDQEFKDLLVSSAKDDPLMRKAQDFYFHKKYFRPAMALASEYAVSLPLILCAIYDACIQQGPKGASELIEKFNDSFESPEEGTMLDEEKAWGLGLIHRRHEFLSNFVGKDDEHTKEVRKSVYRTSSLLDLANRNEWSLSVPLKVKMNRGTWVLTQDILDASN